MVTQGTHHGASRFSQSMLHPTEAIHEYPISSALIMFGVGLGVGVLVGQVLCESMSHAWQAEPTMTEKLSRSIADAIHGVLPEAVSRRVMG